MSDTQEGDKPRFTQAELENSFPIDWGRRLRGEAGRAFLSEVLTDLERGQVRRRAMRRAARELFEDTVSALLANFVVAAFNRVDAERFVAIPFKRDAYAGVASHGAASALRDLLLEREWIEGIRGFVKLDPAGNKQVSRNSRYRAADLMREALELSGVSGRSVTISDSWLLRLNKKRLCGAVPKDVSDSRDVLSAVNRRLAGAAINLPPEIWPLIAERHKREGAFTKAEKQSAYSGDASAVSLYRAFTRGYDFGGRIYGGWWMNIPREYRPHILIDGEPTVECDYVQLHPTMLYLEAKVEPPADAYVMPDVLGGQELRDLAKTTFQRLLNGKLGVQRASSYMDINLEEGEPCPLPDGVNFGDFVTSIIRHNQAISHRFGTGYGVRLQRQDSDLAVGILAKLELLGIVGLPVHDSFIVQEKHASTLQDIMERVFHSRYGVMPRIKAKPAGNSKLLHN